METFIDRMVEEEEQLKERIAKAREFTLTNNFEELSYTEKYLLKEQIKYMLGYYNCLQARIDYYKQNKKELE